MIASSAEELTFARVSDAEHPQRSSTSAPLRCCCCCCYCTASVLHDSSVREGMNGMECGKRRQQRRRGFQKDGF